jgi:hypothetical protein
MKFDYGDEVILRDKDDAGTVAEKVCAVVGITPIETEKQAGYFKYLLGTVLYTVEFGDGTDKLVPESNLRPAN